MKSQLRKYLKIFTFLSVFISATFFLNSCMALSWEQKSIQKFDHLTKGMSPGTVESLFEEPPLLKYNITKDGDNFIVMKYYSDIMKLPVLLTFKNNQLYYWAFDYVYTRSDDELITYIGNYVQTH